MIKLFPHQVEALEQTKGFNRVAYYYDMGLGKTFIGSEKAIELGKNILVVCQKSKVDDWYWHFRENYGKPPIRCNTCDLTKVKEKDLKAFLETSLKYQGVPYTWNCSAWIINYDLIWRRPEIAKLTDYTLLLDESSLIQNDSSKRSKFILNKLNPTNVILLSGTPISGKYELIWSQCNLLGWSISKQLFYRQYVVYENNDDGYPMIVGYKNVERLKRKLRQYGAVFKKTEEVINLPTQNFINIKIAETPEYKKFKRDRIITIDTMNLHEFKDDSDFYGKDVTPRVELVGDTTLTNLLYQRMLCSTYHKGKYDAFADLLDSTNDRLVVFYNFNDELSKLVDICRKRDRPLSFCNGSDKDLRNFETCDNAVILVQYQSGAYGLNLQKANKIIYFSPPLSSDLFEQSKKRIHRIGQQQPCFYYQLKSGIDYRIYNVLEMRRDYTDHLFKEEEENERNID